MPELTLVVGNRNYSSWSFRAGLAMRLTGLEFNEIVIPLDRPDTRQAILSHSPAGRVPVLHCGALAIWDSLAICEHAAELAPEAKLWPGDAAARAVARSISAEMHAGFAALRAALPMNIRADRPGVAVDGPAQADIERIGEIWRDCRARFGAAGPFLFGAPTIADAMFAPVVARFATYHVPLGPVEQAYAGAVRALPEVAEWAKAAAEEPWVIESEEIASTPASEAQ